MFYSFSMLRYCVITTIFSLIPIFTFSSKIYENKNNDYLNGLVLCEDEGLNQVSLPDDSTSNLVGKLPQDKAQEKTNNKKDIQKILTPIIKINNYSLLDEIKLNQFFYQNQDVSVDKDKASSSKKNIATKTLTHFVHYTEPFEKLLNIYNKDKILNSYNEYKIGRLAATVGKISIFDNHSKDVFKSFRIGYETGSNIFPYVEAVPFYKPNQILQQPLTSKDVKKRRSTLFLIGTKIEF